MDTVEKLKRVNRFINKLRRIVIVLILLAAAWITYDVYRQRENAPPPKAAPGNSHATDGK